MRIGREGTPVRQHAHTCIVTADPLRVPPIFSVLQDARSSIRPIRDPAALSRKPRSFAQIVTLIRRMTRTDGTVSVICVQGHPVTQGRRGAALP
ncbi:hypothetical protein ASZ90_009072 [hydrocarbon metagenome]|uniref:Uncharacterized protein n=1 Tax=hydrocarbon metagenome TaxID=938273 RepID=A0A0W8FJY6_9ZZZZ